MTKVTKVTKAKHSKAFGSVASRSLGRFTEWVGRVADSAGRRRIEWMMRMNCLQTLSTLLLAREAN